MKKFDKNYIFYSAVISVFTSLLIGFYIFSSFFEGKDGEDVEAHLDINIIAVLIAAVAVIYLVQVVYAALFVKMSGYELGQKEIRCKRGVLFRKESMVEYKRIHSVNKRQGLIQKLFGIATLMVDSGSTNTAFSAEIRIIEKSAIVDSLVKELKARQEGKTVTEAKSEDAPKEAQKNYFNFTSKLKWAYSAICLVGSAIALFFIGVVGVASFSLVSPFIKYNGDDTFLSDFATLVGVLVCFIILASVIGFAIGILSSFLGYYDFKVFKSRKDIEISYGFFVKNSNTFKRNRIKGIIISQDIIKRLFGFATVSLEVVGYNSGGNGESANNPNGRNSASTGTGVLIPLCKLSEVDSILKDILPEYIPEKKKNKPRCFAPFVLWSYLITAMIIVIPSVIIISELALLGVYGYVINIFSAITILALVLVFAIITLSNVLEYKNSGVTIGADTVSIYRGGFSRKCVVVGKKNIIAMEDITTPLRAKKGVYTFIVHIYTNAQTNTVKVRNLDESMIKLLAQCVND